MKSHVGTFLTLFLVVLSAAYGAEEVIQPSGAKVVPDITKSWPRPTGRDESSQQDSNSLLKVRERLHYQSGSVAAGQLVPLLYKTPSYYPCGYLYTAELRPLSGDPDLYLYQKVSGSWRLIKKSINGVGVLDSFTFTCNDITSSATNVDLDVHGYSAAGYEFSLYREATATPSAFKLRFPVALYTAYSASISSVFDHSAYSSTTAPRNRVVVAYTGETGSYQTYPTDVTCINQASGQAFVVNGHYTGASSCGGKYYLAYDGHNGIDYVFSLGTPVYSTADGTITVSECAKRATGTSCRGRGTGFGKLSISHGSTGYTTIFLHLSYMADAVSVGTWYPKGTLVGYSGQTAPYSISPHLHVSVSKNGVYVDPYGWTGSGTDPYPGLNSGVQNTRLWE